MCFEPRLEPVTCESKASELTTGRSALMVYNNLHYHSFCYLIEESVSASHSDVIKGLIAAAIQLLSLSISLLRYTGEERLDGFYLTYYFNLI